jgi:phosphopantetheinyl transferase
VISSRALLSRSSSLTAHIPPWVHFFPVDQDRAVLEQWLSLLCVGERLRFLEMPAGLDAARFATRRGALRALLASLLDKDPRTLVFTATARGKPVLDPHPVDRPLPAFSVTSSGYWVGIAVNPSGEPVGIDLELIRQIPERCAIAARCMTAVERLRIDGAVDPNAEFLQVWCELEARVKASGVGLSAVDGWGVKGSLVGSSLPNCPSRYSSVVVGAPTGYAAAVVALRRT